MIKLIIPGEPIAKKRPRFVRRGKFVGTYSDQETEEGRWILQAMSQLNGHKISEAPLTMFTICKMKRPKSHYGTGRNAGKLKASAPMYHVKKPDKDNLEKFIMDCLNNVVWKDDAQVFDGRLIKEYTEFHNPRTLIFITPIAKGNLP